MQLRSTTARRRYAGARFRRHPWFMTLKVHADTGCRTCEGPPQRPGLRTPLTVMLNLGSVPIRSVRRVTTAISVHTLGWQRVRCRGWSRLTFSLFANRLPDRQVGLSPGMKKTPENVFVFKGLILVSGAGFEPSTFRLWVSRVNLRASAHECADDDKHTIQ